MNVDAQVFLRLVEKAKTLCFIDLEAGGLRADYSSIYVISIKPFRSKTVSFSVSRPGDDSKIVKEAKDYIESFDCWATYYGKGYDLKMLNTRALLHGLSPIEKRPHIDMYYFLKSAILTSRRSQGHLLSWLQTKQSKMSVSADTWAKVPLEPETSIPILVKRCESDVAGLESLYVRTKHLITEIKI